MYAAGKIPGSFFKREGRAGEKGTLTARMIDRPIRPLFPKGWRRETQLVAIPMSIDHVHPYDILAMNGAQRRADDLRHPVPAARRRGADRPGRGRQLRRQPRRGVAARDATLDLVVAGTEDAILMVEAGANEVSEAEILDALDIAHGEIKKICAAQRELREKAGKPKAEVEVPTGRRVALRRRSRSRFGDDARPRRRRSRTSSSARTRPRRVEERGAREVRRRADDPEYSASQAARRSRSTSSRRRRSASGSPSTRSAPTVAPRTRSAPISIEVGVAPRTHGSALFTRGQTQALSVAALGTTREEMRLDTLGLQTHEALLPPLQLPAVLGRGGRLHARPEAPRHRPRRARRAGARPGRADARGLPVHDSRRVGHPRVERLVVDGVGLRLDRCR